MSPLPVALQVFVPSFGSPLTVCRDLGTLPGFYAGGTAVSDDGSIVVGTADENAGLQGGIKVVFQWTEQTGMRILRTHAVGASVSADGSVVVGEESASLPFRWTATSGASHLPLLPGSSWGSAADVSADGSITVGYSGESNRTEACVWDALGNLQGLGLLSGGNHSFAESVSADGSVVVGHTGFNGRAFRWTESGGMQDLGNLPGASLTQAFGVSADGSVVAGTSGTISSGRAFRWTSTEVGERYCNPVSNSTGRGGLLNVLGSGVASSNDITLAAEFLPQDSIGYFVTSPSQSAPFTVVGSQGALCLGGFIGRIAGPGQVQNSGATGTLSVPIDLTVMPTAIGTVAVQPGDTWNFQAWFRDENPGPTSNFTDAVSVTLQ